MWRVWTPYPGFLPNRSDFACNCNIISLCPSLPRQTRLWKAMRATTVEEILRYCDRYRVTEASGGVPEYFFDRNYTRNGVTDA